MRCIIDLKITNRFQTLSSLKINKKQLNGLSKPFFKSKDERMPRF